MGFEGVFVSRVGSCRLEGFWAEWLWGLGVWGLGVWHLEVGAQRRCAAAVLSV